ncbi:acetyl-CoA carboxylase carboxyltransferase subunit alpha [bacterium]|nr:acetyl-CoA carboxylase carboxyltransferase subunit alpha [candidate division CSSED10-310 bacterium]
MGKMEGLTFEKPIIELEDQIHKLEQLDAKGDGSLKPQIRQLERRLLQITSKIFEKLDPWDIVQVSRHPQRPHTVDYIKMIFTEFTEFHGDRLYRDDPAVITGFARFDSIPVVVIGQEKGRDIQEKVRRNFGMMHPEGYRKALRAMELAERFKMPLMVLVDTPGAYPGIGAEERGQAEAIARNIREMSLLETPIIVSVIGEGGSGGALGIGVGDRVLMQQYAIYSVISPEGCAAILWRDNAKAKEAAEALQVTAPQLLSHRLIDEVVKEPVGGAHRNPQRAASILRRVIRRHLNELMVLPIPELLELRSDKYRCMGPFETDNNTQHSLPERS